jgi:hypothetical protein
VSELAEAESTDHASSTLPPQPTLPVTLRTLIDAHSGSIPRLRLCMEFGAPCPMQSEPHVQHSSCANVILPLRRSHALRLSITQDNKKRLILFYICNGCSARAAHAHERSVICMRLARARHVLLTLPWPHSVEISWNYK